MKNFQRVSLHRFREKLDARRTKSLVVLAGAGVSMLLPTSLPSGDQLRDMCVEALLTDDISRPTVGRLLRAPAYRALLPEAVLQLIGSRNGSTLDRYMRQLLRAVSPNGVHRALSRRKYRVFTTNFDLCFEAAGNGKVRHLHGAISNPETLQNRIYRLGKTARTEAALFGKATKGQVLLILGYSFRDEDIVNLIKLHQPKHVFYLAFDGNAPEPLSQLKCKVTIAKGGAEELFLSAPPTPRKLQRTPSITSTRLPALKYRANALLRICSKAALYDAAVDVLHAYLPSLRGRAKLLAMCEVADSLRLAARYEDAEKLARQVLSDRASRNPSNGIAVSTALNQLGLIALDRGDSDVAEIESFFWRAMKVLESLIPTKQRDKYRTEDEIWRARIFNNLGLVLAAKRNYTESLKMYQQSLRLKLKHHDQYGVVQTRANLARLQVLTGRITEAAASAVLLVQELTRIPDSYICADAINGCFSALAEKNYLPYQARDLAQANLRSARWWREILVASRDLSQPARSIVASLNELSLIWKKLQE
jgi:tetratricopeptide (TPR) repeat protein